MKLKRIVLKEYKALMVAGISYFETSPKSDQVIIIGSNGSGKSSITRAITPLPFSASEFSKEGIHLTEWEHKGSHYVLTSDFKSSQVHSFSKDGKELNQGGTAKVQSALVKEHFGMDTALQNLFLSKQPQFKFSTMTPLQRRDWIMRISGGDFSFAMAVLDKINGQLRDTMGAIRHSRNRLVELEKDRVSEEDVEEYQKQLDKINLEFSRISDMSQAMTQIGDISHKLTLDQLEQEERRIAAQLDRLQKTMHRHLEELTGYGIAPNSYDTQAHQFRQEHALVKQRIDNLLENLNAANEQQQMLQQADSVENLKEQCRQSSERVDQNMALLDDTTKQLLEETNPAGAIQTFGQIGQDLNGIFTRWSYDKAGTHNEATLLDKQQRIDKLNGYIEANDRTVNNLQHRLAHMRNTDNVKCPRCSLDFKPGLNSGDEASVESEIEKRSENIKIAKQRRKDYADECDEIQEFIALRREYTSLCRNTPTLSTLWHMLNSSRVLEDPKSNAGAIIAKWQKAMGAVRNIQDARRDVDAISQKLSLIEKMSDTPEAIQKRKDELETKLNAEYDKLNGLNEKINRDQRVQQLIKEIGQIIEETKSQAKLLDELTTSAIYHYGLQLFNNVKQEAQTDAHQINSLLLRATGANSVIKEVETSLNKLTKDHEAFVVLSSELSPKEGLIADLLNAFILRMLEDMNMIIEAVWSYGFEVKPCSKEDGDLDFKFPINVKHGDLKPADISLGSTSQIDIVDFVFIEIVTKYLEMSDRPMVLDEPFTSLDEVHRRKIVHYFSQLIETNMCSQVFMISHYSETHNSFPHAEYIVTDPTNVTVPSVYNENTVIK